MILELVELNELLSTSLLYLEAWETGLTHSGNGTAMHGSNIDQLLKAILHIYDIANMR
jgi:hypothetical protein